MFDTKHSCICLAPGIEGAAGPQGPAGGLYDMVLCS